LEEKFELVSRVEGIQGVELKYPADFEDIELTQDLMGKHGLQICAVNVDIKNADYFRYGALSAREPEARQHAIRLLQEGMDVAADLGANLVTTCPLADGYDYPFQMDYTAAWGRFVNSVKSVVKHRPDVRLCLEYQPHEPHARIMLNNVGKALHVCSEVGAPNLGINLDVGHSLAAGESPAEAASLLAAKGRLFYVHTNDNTGDGGDWDMISGTIHFWQWLEFIYTIHSIGYDGWFGGDIAPKHIDPVAAYSTNIRMVQRMTEFIRRIGTDKIAELLSQDGNIADTFDYLSGCLLQDQGEVKG
jgi:xylose isomerase